MQALANGVQLASSVLCHAGARLTVCDRATVAAAVACAAATPCRASCIPQLYPKVLLALDMGQKLATCRYPPLMAPSRAMIHTENQANVQTMQSELPRLEPHRIKQARTVERRKVR